MLSLLLAAGATRAHEEGAAGHVHLVDGSHGGCDGCPLLPTGYVEPGPGDGNITVHWAPAATGPAPTGYFVGYHERGTAGGFVGWGHAADDSRRQISLKPGVAYDVVVSPWNDTGNGKRAQASNVVTPTTPPSLQLTWVDGGTLKMLFGVALSKDSVPAEGQFSVSLAGTAQTPTAVAVDGRVVTLTLGTAATAGQSATVSYTRPASNPLRDGAGNRVADFAGKTAINATGDTTAPTADSAALAAPNMVSVTYSEELDPFAVPGVSQFIVRDDYPTKVAIAGKTLTLTFSRAVAQGETVTFQYGAPPARRTDLKRLQDLAGNAAGDFSLSVERLHEITVSTPPFALDSATVDGGTLKLVLSLTPVEDSIPAKGSFSVSLGGTAQPPTGVSVDGKTVTLTLATAAAPGQGAVVTYTKPRSKPLRDVYGRELAGFAKAAINVAGGVASAAAGEDREVLTGASVTLSGSGSSTRSNPTYSYKWTQTAGVSVTLSGADTATPSFTAPSVRTDLEFSLTVNDGVGDSAADTVTVRVRPPPHPTSAPCVHPAPAWTAFWGGSLLDSVTADDTSISFRGTGLSAARNSFWFCRPDGTRDTLDQEVAGGSSDTVTGLARATRYWLAVKWTDIRNVVRWQNWQAVSTTGGTTADAGADRTVDTGSTVTLSGSGSSTRPGATFTYTWTQTGGPSVTLSGAATATPSFTAPALRNDLVFSLTVNDGDEESEADTVTVLVRPPPNPTSAPCVQPTLPGGNLTETALFVVTGTTDSAITYRGTSQSNITSLWFCRPDGTRQLLGEGLHDEQPRTVSGLASGTTYWVTALHDLPDHVEDVPEFWNAWKAVTTTGAASVQAVRFTSSPASGRTYVEGETIRAAVTWSKPVTVANGGSNANVSLRLDLGADDTDRANSRKAMGYVSGSGTTTLTFEYVVKPGDVDADGVWLQTASATDDAVVFLANGATLRNGTTDVVRTRGGLPTTGDAGRKVDASISVASVRFTSSPASGDSYLLGETVRAAVTWSKPVTVANGGSNANVSLRLDLGADDTDLANSRRAMRYVSGSGTATLTFEYAIKPGDTDADGVWVQTASAADATVVFLANGATLRNGTTDVVRTRGGLPTTGDAGRKVDGSTSATADAGEDREAVSGATVTLSGSGSSTRANPSYSYRWSQSGGPDVTLSGANTATPSFTAPALRSELVFSLVVNDGTFDSVADTVTVRVRPPPNPTSAPCAHPRESGLLNNITELNVRAGSGSITFEADTSQAGRRLDVWLCRPDGTREEIATGLSDGQSTTKAGLSSGTTYWYASEKRISTVTSWSRWQAITTTGAASIRAARFSSSPDSGDTYLAGETVRAAVTWSKPVTVANGGSNANVRLRLDVGADDADRSNSRRSMRYVSGSGTTTLVFEYGVRPGDADADGVWLQSASAADATMVFLANGATLRNGSTDVSRTRSGLATTGDAGRKVDGSMAHPQAPVADAGADRTVETGASVTLDGGASTDPNGDTLTYAWEQTGGPAVTLSGANTATPSFTAPALRSELVFSLAVNDGARDGAADEVTVRVRPPPNPTSAPCAHPRESGLLNNITELNVTAGSDSITFVADTSQAGRRLDVWLCRPDGTREEIATGLSDGQSTTKAGLSSGTTYWYASEKRISTVTSWSRWQAITTTGAASIRAVRFTSSPASGDTYLLGETVRAAVTWSMPVTVDAKGSNDNVTVRLDLGADDANLGNSRRTMAYVSGSGTTTLTFAYTVKPGDFDPDGVWLQTESATVHNLVAFANGATIRNGTVDASITRAGLPTTGDASRKVDGGPSLPRAAVQGTTLVLTYDEALDSGSVPAAVAFTVKRSPPGGSAERARLAGTPAIDRAKVTLTLAEAVAHGDAVTVGYTAPSANPLRDASGNRVAEFADRAVTNNTGDPGDATKPTLVQGKIHQSAVELTFSEPLDDSVAPAASQFALSPGLGALSGVSVSGRTIAFTTATAATATQSVSLGIATTTGIRDLNGNALDPVSGFALINTLTADPGAPALAAANPAAVDRARLTLTFDQTLHAAQVPAAGAFTVTAAGAGRGVAGAAVEGSTVVLTLASETASGETVTVSFDATKGAIQNPWGTRADSFTDRAVANNTVNRAPVFTTTSGRINSPSGTLVSLDAKATDPDGDAVTYSWSLSRDDHYVPDELKHILSIGRFFFMARHECELANLPPEAGQDRPPNPIETVVTVTASDPHGASAELPLTYHTDWSSCEAPALSALSADGKTVTLTFTESLAAPTAKQLDDLSYAFTIQGARYLGTPVENQSPEVAVSGATVTLRLGSGIPPGGEASVSYDADLAATLGASLGDAEGNKVRRFVRTASAGTASGTVRPLLTEARVAGTALTLTFDKALDEGSAPAGSRFQVSTEAVDGRVPRRLIRGTGMARVSGKEVAVRLAAPVEQYERAHVLYLKGDDANPLRGTSSGPEVADIHGFLNTAVHDRTAPTVVSAAVAGTKLALYYNEALDRHSTPAAGDFVVTAAGAAQTVSGVSVNASAVTLTLGAEVASGASVAVSYTAGAEPIRDLEGNDAANLTSHAATNHGPTDTAAPALVAKNAAVAQHGVLKLAWNKPLDPAHVPDPNAFELSPSARRSVTSVAVRGATVELGLSRWVNSCSRRFTVTYTVPSGAAAAKALRSVWGTAAAALAAQTVAIVDRDFPWCPFVRGSVQGESGTLGLSMRFDRPLSRRSVPSRAAFAVRSDGGGGAPAGPVAVEEVGFPADPAGLTLTLDRTLVEGERLTVGYRQPVSGAGLRDADGNGAAPFSVETVVGAGAPAVTGVAVASDPGTDATYAAGDTVRVDVTFGEAVEVDATNGTPRLKLDLDADEDSGERWAAYESGSGTATLTFAWAAAAPDEAAAGIAVPADTLELNGGTIASAATGAAAALGHAGLDRDPAHKVDAVPPELLRGEIDGGRMTLFFSEALDADATGGRFLMGVQTSETESLGCYARGNVAVDGAVVTVGLGLDKVCPPAQAGLDGNEVTYFWRADGGDGALRDLAGNLLAPDGDAGIGLYVQIDLVNVTGTGAAVAGVEVTSDAGTDATYALSETIRVAVTFSKVVEVDTTGGTPGLTIDLDPAEWGEKRAAYESGSGTDTLTFVHEVVEPNISTQGIAVLADTLALDGGTIRSVATQVVDALLGHAGLDHDPAHKVDWRLAPAPVAVTGVEVTSDAGADGAYTEGEAVEAEVTFDAAVEVDTTDGTPTLALIANGGIRRAAYVSGSGTATLAFAYRAVEADGSLAAPARVAASGLKLNGGAIVAAGGGAAASLAFGEAPGVTAASVGTQADGRWEAGDTVEVTLVFAEPVAVEGAPTVAVSFGDVERRAAYARGSGSEELTFAYTLAEAEVWQGTAGLAGDSLALGDGSIVSAGGGLAAALAHLGVEGGAAPVPPSVTGVAVMSDAGSDATYGLGERIRVRVGFSGAVTVTGSPGIAIDMDPAEWGEKRAVYESGSGSPTLVFVHEVVEPNLSTQGIAVLADTLGLDGGAAIRSTATGDDALLGHTGLAHDPAHKVDWRLAPPAAPGGAPAVAGVAVVSDAGADNTYLLGDTIRVRLTFSEAVKVTGAPRLSIDMDPAEWGEKRAVYEGATGAAVLALTFAYTVVEPNWSPQGIAVLASSLDLNGGAIRSAASGAAAALGHAGLPHDPAHRVDWRPALSVADARAREGVDEAVEFEVSLDRAFTGAGHRVTVDYATADGTATAGEDYTATSGSLTFAAGEKAAHSTNLLI